MPALPPLRSDSRVRAAYAEGAGIYRIIPQAVVIPRDVAELQAVVQWAATERQPLVPRGAGSGMTGGNVGGGTLVDLSRGFAELTVDPERGVARAGASVTAQAINAAARPHGLRLPPDPSSGGFATSGGMVATNAAGPRSVRYGSVRRWVEALEIVDAHGAVRTLTRGEGKGEKYDLSVDQRRMIGGRFPRTRKNSSGYALDRYAETGDEIDLVVGSEGTLALVTAVEWRLDAVPPHVAGAALGFRTLDALEAAVPFLVTLDASAVELLDRTLLDLIPDSPTDLACLLLVEFERETGPAARGVVGDAVRGLKDRVALVETAIDRVGLERLWAIRRLASPTLARLPATRRSLQIVEDGCVPVAALGEYIAGVRASAARHRIPVAMFGHAGDGHVHVNALPDVSAGGWLGPMEGLYDDVCDLLIRLGGVPSGEHGIGRLRAGILERFYGPEIMALFAAVKRRYDPLSILNPGVIIPAADWRPLTSLKVGERAASIPDDIAAQLRDVERTAGWGTPKTALADPNP